MDPVVLISLVIVIFFGIGLHEYAHCKFADMAGDPTPRFYGRVTLNLFKHFDPMGTIMMFIAAASGVGIGWGKPAPVDPSKMRNPRWDFFISVIAGPISNLIQAVVWTALGMALVKSGLIAYTKDYGFVGPVNPQDLPSMVIWFGIRVNIGLAFFNLIPFGVLDGHWIVGTFLPEKQRYYWYKFNHGYGVYIFIGLILFSQTVGRSSPSLDLLGLYYHGVVNPVIAFFTKFLL